MTKLGGPRTITRPRQLLSPDIGGSAATRKVVGIAQPTYIPWCGFFALLDACDEFVLLDSVPVSKQSWQTRNRIRARDGRVSWLSVPVHAHMGQPLCEVRIDNGRPWQKKHWRTIQQAYSHTPGWGLIEQGVYLGAASEQGLTAMTGYLIKSLARTIGITTRIVLASELGPTRDGKVERLEDLLTMTQATSYLCSRGSTYLEGQSHIGSVPIEWFDYEHPVYQQGNHTEFVSHLSVIDLIAHSGADSLNILRHNYALQCETSAQSARN